jgi:hypothetical protein
MFQKLNQLRLLALTCTCKCRTCPAVLFMCSLSSESSMMIGVPLTRCDVATKDARYLSSSQARPGCCLSCSRHNLVPDTRALHFLLHLWGLSCGLRPSWIEDM